MTVEALIAVLQHMPPGAKVLVDHGYPPTAGHFAVECPRLVCTQYPKKVVHPNGPDTVEWTEYLEVIL